MAIFELLAQIPTSQPVTDAVTTSQPAPSAGNPWIFLGIMALVFWFVVFRPRKKEQNQRADMLKSLKKHDKVMTIGGVIGTVMEVRDDEVVLKVDDNSNTRIRFIRSAIQKVLVQPEVAKNPTNVDGKGAGDEKK